jgi:hypothetical protein
MKTLPGKLLCSDRKLFFNSPIFALMKRFLVLFSFLISAMASGQTHPKELITKNLTVYSDTVFLDSVSINPEYFEVFDATKKRIEPDQYTVDFSEAKLWFGNHEKYKGAVITVTYLPLPDFMTRYYSAFDKSLIVQQTTDESRLYSNQSGSVKKNVKPFDGLYTSGSLSRGVTIGNNQDAVVNSNFNLQIEGQLSEKVGIRASITDNEIPLQSGGFTQRLDEFDRVFIELFSDKWSLTAGDVDLINTDSYLMRFQKKISGVLVKANLDSGSGQTDFFASGALVKGKFNSYKFNGSDGNQGPYKILGPENQQYAIMISGSERVYANGVLLKRGENFDYVIDYNTGEISFTTLYTVTSNLRFTVEYQLSERNYTRFMTYDGVRFSAEKFNIGVKYYNETDSKNNPIDQNLSEDQKKILADAGNDISKMVSPSATEAEYDENRILYRKLMVDGREIYEFSNNQDDQLYQVNFSYTGENRGNYVIETNLAAGRVYRYVAPVNNEMQGSYLPIVQLIAPEKLQMFDLEASYAPNDKTLINTELALSDKDQNLFSAIDNEENKGFAAKLAWDQKLIDKKWKLNSDLDYEYFSENFKSIERVRNVEFSRDWNIIRTDTAVNQKQQYFLGGLRFSKDSVGSVAYGYENLTLGKNYRGDRHNILANIHWNKTEAHVDASLLKNENGLEENTFERLYSGMTQAVSNFWVGAKFNYEKNQRELITTGAIDKFSHRFTEFEGFFGIGDSTKIFAEIGYNYRETDSVIVSTLANVSKANTFFLKSKLIQNQNTDLAFFANYRTVKNVNIPDEEALNGRIIYRQKIFGDFILLQTNLQTNSGTLPQQEFSYVEVEPGKGFYEWIDFNDNGVQELDEFVVAQFQDQAIYVRVLLPTVNFIKINQNKWSQSVNLNASSWKTERGFKRVMSHFANQTYFLIDSRTKRENDDFNINPFPGGNSDVLGLDQNLKNSLFFNRGQQKFSMVYSYLNFRKKTIYSFGDQEVETKTHQFQFVHKMGSFWLVDAEAGISENTSQSVSYANRNYQLENITIRPKISYLYNKNTRLEVFYTYKNKENQIRDMETLQMHNFGVNFQYANKDKFAVNANANLYFNEFNGNTNSPVAYQMLEGLQPGTNLTWLLGVQKRLTSFLDLNLNYFGRKSEEAKTIHTGNIQLRATF